jgi:ferredoxin
MSEIDEKEQAIGEPLGVVSGPAVNLSEMPTIDVAARVREESQNLPPPEKPLVKLKVTFMPMNVTHEIDANETVLHLAQRHDIHIQSVCKGLPSCAECRVCIKEGEHHVPPPSSKELSLIGTAHYIDRSRLSCQLRCYGDIVVDLTEQLDKATRVAKQPQGRANRKEGEVSHAVKGNIIEEFHDDSGPIEQIAPTEQRPGHDNFYEEPKKNQNQNQNQRKGQGNQNNRNNRNNNRNKGPGGNRPNQGQGQGPRQGAQGSGPRPPSGNQGGGPGSSRPQPAKNR